MLNEACDGDSSVTQQGSSVMEGSNPSQSEDEKLQRRKWIGCATQVKENRGGLPKYVWQTVLGRYYPGVYRREIGTRQSAWGPNDSTSGR